MNRNLYWLYFVNKLYMYLNFVEMKVGRLVYKHELRFSEQYVFTNVCGSLLLSPDERNFRPLK